MKNRTRKNSPLARVAARKGLAIADARRQLSPQDAADLKRVLEEKYEYTAAEVFALPEKQAMKEVFDDAPEVPVPDVSWYHPVMDAGKKPAATPRKMGSVVLTAEQERTLFVQYNYCRFRVCAIRDELKDMSAIDLDMAEQLLHWYHRAEAYRDQIAQTNLALVLAMAKRTRMSDLDFGDMVSEGNMALLRAIDKFDAGRGFKFSTYGCRAILKAFSRAGMKLSKYRSVFPAAYDPEFEKSNYQELKNAEHEEDCADEVKRIVETNQADLSEIEQRVIRHRFNLIAPDIKDDPPAPVLRTDGKPLTLQQVGQIIGVTKERVRQIQKRAMEKIRGQLETQYLA
ncbi:MAG: sigma-70 family RNA polymerase sigma factor [Planctomycetota bacterium]